MNNLIPPHGIELYCLHEVHVLAKYYCRICVRESKNYMCLQNILLNLCSRKQKISVCSASRLWDFDISNFEKAKGFCVPTICQILTTFQQCSFIRGTLRQQKIFVCSACHLCVIFPQPSFFNAHRHSTTVTAPPAHCFFSASTSTTETAPPAHNLLHN